MKHIVVVQSIDMHSQLRDDVTQAAKGIALNVEVLGTPNGNEAWVVVESDTAASWPKVKALLTDQQQADLAPFGDMPVAYDTLIPQRHALAWGWVFERSA